VSRVSRFVVVVLALAASACTTKPGGFGVNVEARTSMLPSATRNAIVNARLVVTGAEEFAKDIPNAAQAAKSGAFKFHYVPGVQSGTITIKVDGVDGGGNTIASGISPPINLAAGKSVDTVFFLATNGNGVPCMTMTDCISNNCVDGVCCDTPCDGVCETCGLPGQPGVCSPQPMGMDPDNDCAAKIPMQQGDVDGGTEDGGVTTGVTGVTVSPQACAGTCNGNRACDYPGTTTSCGANFCPAVATSGSFFCDGAGSCDEKDTMCTDYVCTGGACSSICNANSDCQSSDFCNLNINKCVPRHDNGTACANGFECKTGFCAQGFCCNTDCAGTGQSCSVNPGQCQCQSHPCPMGVACQLFYKDGDADTYGDATGTIANGRAVAGCVGDMPPTGFVADDTDCNDADNRQHPNQTGYFDTPSNVKGDFDYNCDGDPSGPEKYYAEYPGGSCGFCSGTIGTCNHNTTCTTAGNSSAFGCGFVKIGMFFCTCCNINTSAFTQTVACGVAATLVNCGTCAANGGPAGSTTTPNVKQACH
jgi:hypothetical protein